MGPGEDALINIPTMKKTGNNAISKIRDIKKSKTRLMIR
jgi:hypothetical protein